MYRNALMSGFAAAVFAAADKGGSGAKGAAKAFELTDAHRVLMAEINTANTSGNTRYVSQAEAGELVTNGYVEVNPQMLDAAGNAAARLTEKGAAEVAATNPADNNGNDDGGSLFTIVAAVELPQVTRKGSGGGGKRESKYPLKDIPLGGALFVRTKEGQTTKQLSKALGSTVSSFNRNNPDKFLTARTVEDGTNYGHAGVSGVAIHHRPVSERKVKQEKAAE
jgi:hypothetical protein